MSAENFCVIVKDGKVSNIIVVEPNSPVLNKHPEWIFIGENPDRIAIGWLYDGTNFSPPPPPVEPELEIPTE